MSQMDSIRKGISDDDFDASTRSHHNHSSNIFSNDVGTFEGRPDDESPPTESNDYESLSNGKKFETQGTIDFDMILINDPEDDGDGDGDDKEGEGAVLAMEKSNVKVSCSIPPKSGSNWFASFNGNTGLMKLKGFGRSTLSLGYMIWDGTAILYDWNTADGLCKNSFGASLQRKDFKTEAKVHYPSIRKAKTQSTIASVQHCMNVNNEVSTNVEIGVAMNPKRLTSLSAMRIGFKTIHDTRLPHLQVYIDFFNKLPLKVCYQQEISSVEKTSTEASFALGNKKCEVKALLSRSLDQFSKFSIGVRHSTWEGLCWIFSMEKGELKLNVPIRIASFATTGYSSVMYSISAAYVSLLSATIHAAMGEVLERSRKAVSMDMKMEEKLLSEEKAREDAESQIMLMTRKADINRRSEESKSGLVIEKATYSVNGGTCLDVTIPLQFWVIDSQLKLAASSFGGMLGFYDINKISSSKNRLNSSSATSSGLVGLWKMIIEPPHVELTVPVLYVMYKFNGTRYHVNTLDNEALILPSRRAMEIKDEVEED